MCTPFSSQYTFQHRKCDICFVSANLRTFGVLLQAQIMRWYPNWQISVCEVVHHHHHIWFIRKKSTSEQLILTDVTGSGRPLVWNSSDWDGFKLVLRPKTNYSPPLSKKTKLIATLCFVYISHLAFVIKKKPTNTKIKMSKTCRLSRAISWRQPWLMRDTDFGEILPSASFWSKMIAGSTFAHFKGKIVFD